MKKTSTAEDWRRSICLGYQKELAQKHIGRMFTHFNNDSLIILVSTHASGRFALCYSTFNWAKS